MQRTLRSSIEIHPETGEAYTFHCFTLITIGRSEDNQLVLKDQTVSAVPRLVKL